MREFIALTIRRRITVLMMAVATALVGVAAYVLLPVELLPKGMASQTASIRIPITSSNPEEVQEQVIRPTEEQIRTIPGIEEIESRAGANRASIQVSFSADVDIDLAMAELRDRLERARATWPDQVRDYRIFRFNLDTDIPIFSFPIDLDRYTKEVTFLVEEKVVKAIEALPGVARVTCWGLLDDQIRIFVDQELALSHGINIFQLQQELAKANVEVTGGTMRDGEKRWALRTDARLRTIEEIRKLPVNDQGLRLEQIAKIEPVKAVREFVVLSRNKRTLWCQVYKESTANTVEVARRVRELVKGHIASDPRLLAQGATARTFDRMDMGLIVEGALSNLKETAAVGAILALFVLFFFLRRLRLTLVITLAIPLSLLLTLGVLYFSGSSLNLLAMLGITIAIGMLIDNGIVVVENMARHRDEGLPPFQAAVKGASEVGLAITLSTLTTVAAFLPIIFMSGGQQMSFFTKGIGLPLCWAVLSSLFVALVFIPLATTVIYRGRVSGTTGWRHSRLIERGQNVYGRLLERSLKGRFATILLVILPLVVLTGAGLSKLKLNEIMDDSGGQVRARVELDRNFTLSDAYDIFRRLGGILEENRESHDIEHFWCFFSRTGGRFSISLTHRDKDRTKDAVKRIRELLPEVPGARIRIGREGQEGDRGKISLSIYGPRPDRLVEISQRLGDHLETIAGVSGVECDLVDEAREIHVIPDREKTLRYGIDPRVLRGSIGYGLRGFWFSDLIQGEQEIPLIIEYEGASERTLGQFRETPIPSRSGARIPLSEVAEISEGRGLGEIRRTDGKARALLTIDTDREDKAALIETVVAAAKRWKLPPGYSFQENSGQKTDEAVREVKLAGILAMVFVYLLMGILFESWILPLGVIVAIPFSWTGAVWSIILTKTPLDFVGMIGLIVLVGIVVNNGIVLLDCAQQLMKEGHPRRWALVQAGRRRFRPILMTAGTTIVGLLPMALADSTGSTVSYKALSRALIGGLVSSTLLTLLFVPVFYSLFDDLRLRTERGIRRIRRRMLG